MSGGILALDLARVTGFAYGVPGDQTPVFGSWHLPHIGGEGARFAAFENELVDALERFQPGRLLLEAPVPLPALNNRAAALQQMGLRGIAVGKAWHYAIPFVEIDAGTVRRELLGRSRFDETGRIKKEVLAACRKRGWKVPDHNAGDACLLWLYIATRLTSGMASTNF